MQEHISYQQFKAIKKSVIVSDLTLIVFTAITFCASLFVQPLNFFVFALSCFLIKLLTNLWVEKKYRFPSWIHLFAPVPFSLFFYIIYPIAGFCDYFIISKSNHPLMGIAFLVLSLFVAVAFTIVDSNIKKFFKLQTFFPFIRLCNYYNLIGNLIYKEVALCLLVLQTGCFLSIILSIFLAMDFGNPHPIERFVFSGLFSPLLYFALFNLIEIFVFLLVKFPQEGKSFEQAKFNILKFILTLFLTILMALFIANTPYFFENSVKRYLGTQYEPIMEKLINLSN